MLFLPPISLFTSPSPAVLPPIVSTSLELLSYTHLISRLPPHFIALLHYGPYLTTANLPSLSIAPTHPFHSTSSLPLHFFLFPPATAGIRQRLVCALFSQCKTLDVRYTKRHINLLTSIVQRNSQPLVFLPDLLTTRLHSLSSVTTISTPLIHNNILISSFYLLLI